MGALSSSICSKGQKSQPSAVATRPEEVAAAVAPTKPKKRLRKEDYTFEGRKVL